MRLLLVLVAALAAAAAAAVPSSVKLVFSGHSATEYNRWLHQHAGDSLGLRPIHVQIDSEAARDSGRYSYYVSFLDDTGAVTRERTFTGARGPLSAEEGGKWFYARTSDNGDVLFVSQELGFTTVYNQTGDSMFTSTEGSVDGSGGLFFRQLVDGEGTVYRDYYDVLDRTGRVVSRIALGTMGEGEGLKTNYPFVHSRDTTYVMHAGLFVSVIDKHGNVLWQATPKYYAAVAISEDGKTAAVATPASLVVRRLDSERTFMVGFPEGKILDSLWAAGSHRAPSGGYFAHPEVAINGDGSRVAVFRRYNIWSSAGAALLDVYSGDGTPVCQGRRLTPGLIKVMGFAGDGMVFAGDAGPVRDSLAEPGTGHPRKPSKMVRWLITKADLSNSVSATEVTVERTAVPRLVSNAVVFYGKDSIYVYRIGAAPNKQRK